MELLRPQLSRFFAIVLATSALGCSGGCSGSSAASGGESGQSTTAAGSDMQQSSGDQPAEVVEAVDEGPAPTLAIRGLPARYGRNVEIRVENRGGEEASLAREVLLQRQMAEGWVDVSAGISLRDDCQESPQECLQLGVGAAYLAAPWTGMQGDAQCICTRCAPAEAGTYRFVVSSCHGTHRIEGESFEFAPAR